MFFRTSRQANARLNHASMTPVKHKPSLDFSLTGLVFCSMMMFMGLAAINSQANLLFGVFGLMIGVLLVSGTISKLVLRKLSVHRVLPEAAVVGQPATLIYEFSNTKRYWPSLSVALGELDGTEAFTAQPFCYMLHAAPGMTATVPIEITPKRRGVHTMDRYQLSTGFPFGFIKRATTTNEKESIVVYPALAEVDPKLLALCRSSDTTGATMRPRQGGNDEFYGVKEFRAGQNPRHIYWRRSARTGVLVSKEMTQVAPPRLILLVDSFLPESAGQHLAAVERAIAMAASLASHALESGLLVGMCAWSKGFISIAPNRGKRHRRDLLALLAQLPRNSTHETQSLMAASQAMFDPGNTPVLITPREIPTSLGDHLRTGLLSLSSTSPSGQRWFRFEPNVNFETAMPLEQQVQPPKPAGN